MSFVEAEAKNEDGRRGESNRHRTSKAQERGGVAHDHSELHAAPKAAVADETLSSNADFVPGGQPRPAANGWTWIAEGSSSSSASRACG